MDLFESDQVRPDLVWSGWEDDSGVRSVDGSGVLDVDQNGEIEDGGAVSVKDIDSGGGIGGETWEREWDFCWGVRNGGGEFLVA